MESINHLEELNIDEKAKYIIDKVNEIKDHFLMKASKAKRLFYLYKNLSIVLAGLTTILASLQVMYPQHIPLWLLPVVSAATISNFIRCIKRSKHLDKFQNHCSKISDGNDLVY